MHHAAPPHCNCIVPIQAMTLLQRTCASQKHSASNAISYSTPNESRQFVQSLQSNTLSRATSQPLHRTTNKGNLPLMHCMPACCIPQCTRPCTDLLSKVPTSTALPLYPETHQYSLRILAKQARCLLIQSKDKYKRVIPCTHVLPSGIHATRHTKASRPTKAEPPLSFYPQL